MALSLLGIASGEAACAYIDVSDSLSPQSAAAAGVELANLLWVRFASAAQPQTSPTQAFTDSKPFDAEIGRSERKYGGRGCSHPRGETQGLAPALEQMLIHKEEWRRRKMEGTPGYPNQPLGLHTASQDQVEWERWNLRRVDETDPLRHRDRQAAEAARVRAASSSPAVTLQVREQKPWDRLDRALRATDQVLQSGGFRVVVLDLASIAPKQALRVPSATWFRFRRAAQESDSILLLLTQQPCARSSAACVLAGSRGEPPQIQGVLTAVPHLVEIARQRSGPALGRKEPGRATEWDAAPASMRRAGW